MMHGFLHILVSVLILAGLILGAAGLKGLGVIEERHGQLFGGLVTRVTLPALIFHALATTRMDWSEADLALVMLAGELGCLVLAWSAARLLRLDRPATGAFLLASAFGSSTLLGYPLLGEIFPGNSGALIEGVMISELGVGPAIFTIGVMAAMYYGSREQDGGGRWAQAARYFISPIFLAVVLGLACSLAGPLDPDGPFKPFLGAVGVVGQANTFLAVLTVGVLLRFQDIRSALAPALAACLVLLLAQPSLVWLLSQALGLESEAQRQVLVLESSMPSALLSVALSVRYGCDGGLASRLVLATAAAGVVSIPVVFSLLG